MPLHTYLLIADYGVIIAGNTGYYNPKFAQICADKFRIIWKVETKTNIFEEKCFEFVNKKETLERKSRKVKDFPARDYFLGLKLSFRLTERLNTRCSGEESLLSGQK